MKKVINTINQDFREKKFSLYDLLGYSLLVGIILKMLGMS